MAKPAQPKRCCFLHGVRTVTVHVARGVAGAVILVFGLALCVTLILAPLGLLFVLVGMTLLSMVGQPLSSTD